MLDVGDQVILERIYAGDQPRVDRASKDDQPVRAALVHSVGGLVVLLVPLVLNIHKPRGLTRYAWRQAQRRRASRGG